VIDIVPEQVPEELVEQFFKVEKYYLKNGEVRRKFANLMLKLSCYFKMEVMIDNDEEGEPLTPEALWVIF